MKSESGFELFTDGGTVGPNPSPIGGSWAWILVRKGRLMSRASGLLTPEDAGLGTISNNVAELYAALRGIEALPEGFAGAVWTDSLITLNRLMDGEKWSGVPEWLQKRVVEARSSRKWSYDCSLLGGHPNRDELFDGKRKDGKIVSRWNVYCDEMCKKIAKRYKT